MNFLRALGSYLFPRVCHLCGLPLPGGREYVCPSCLARMPRTLYHRMPGNPMEQRFMGLFPFRRATGHFFYSRGSDLALLMADLKYRRFRGLAFRLGAIVGEELLATGFFSDVDVIAPVPMHFMKKARRGYNQAEEICRGLSRAVSLPVSLNLKAVRGHRTQTAMTLDERRENTSGIFRLDRPEEIDGRHLLLVDDVCTTGSTLASAAEQVLSRAPGATVSLLTVGVTF